MGFLKQSELPPQRRGELVPDAEAIEKLTDRLAKDGAELILARMKGATN